MNRNYQEIPEGIDSIVLSVNWLYVNASKWHSFDNENSISLRRRFGYGNNNYASISIQNEALRKDAFAPTIKQQIIDLLLNLFHYGCLYIPVIENLPINVQRQWIEMNIHQLVKLTGLDFFFDYKVNDIKIMPGLYETTTYSQDHKQSRSLWIAYDRKRRLKALKRTKYKTIDDLEYPKRVETRFTRHTCNYMNIDNLDYQYFKILENHLYLIARSWRKYSNTVALVKQTSYHPLFNYIQFLAVSPVPSAHNLLRTDSCF